MLYDQLKQHCAIIGKLDTLPKDSKEYKRTFSALRLALDRYAVQDFKNAQKGEPLYFYKKEYNLRRVISAILLIFAFLIIAFIIVFFGDVDTSANENILICVLLAVSVLLSFVSLGITFTIQTLTDEYLNSALDEFRNEKSNENA